MSEIRQGPQFSRYLSPDASALQVGNCSCRVGIGGPTRTNIRVESRATNCARRVHCPDAREAARHEHPTSFTVKERR